MTISITHSTPGFNYTDVWGIGMPRGSRGPIRTHGARWRPRQARSHRKISGYAPRGALLQSIRSI